MNKTYGAMIAVNKEVYLEAIWEDVEERLKGSSDQMLFFCGKPLNSSYYDETYENIIFKLMEKVHLDGLITLAGSLTQYCGKDYFANYLKRFNYMPIVNLSAELDGYFNVLVDNYKGFGQLVNHAIFEHGFTRFAFIAGSMDNEEALERYKSLLDILNENGLSLDKSSFYQGDFMELDGYKGAEVILKACHQQPEVIICANDEMAIGAMKYLKEIGLIVPEDIAVLGFDDIESASLQEIPLTTIKQPFAKKMTLAYDMLQSEEEAYTAHISGDVMARASCGCSSKVMSASEEYEQKRLYMNKYLESVESFKLTMHLNASFTSITNLEELKYRMKRFIKAHGISELYVCLFDGHKIDVDLPDLFEFPEDMNCYLGYNNGVLYEDLSFETSKLLPEIVLGRSHAKTYMIYGLVFKNTCYGYLVADSKTTHSMAFVGIKDMLISVLNRIDVHKQLSDHSAEMEAQSLKDPLTDLYNRRGFDQMLESRFDQLIKQGKTPAVVYCDLVNLKGINDGYGHESGDHAIVEAANILRRYYGHQSIISRIGGDEYLVFIDHITNEACYEMKNTLNRQIQERNEALDLPYKILISIGIGVYDAHYCNTLKAMIRLADKYLYEGRNNGN